MIVNIPVSVGELIDKITILMIKEMNAKDAVQLGNIKKELELLQTKFDDLGLGGHPATESMVTALMGINAKLWQLEDDIRVKMRNDELDFTFINTAVDIHHSNDERSRIKRQINELFNSEIIEEKIY